MRNLALLLLLGLLFLPNAFADCGVGQRMMRLSDTSNAHVESPMLSNYPVQICYDEIFGKSLISDPPCPHDCDGPDWDSGWGLINNPIIEFAGELQGGEITNAHAQADGYPAPGYSDICFADLVCDVVDPTRTCADYNPSSECIVTLSEVTNAHLAVCNAPESYGFKLCCSSAYANCGNGALDTDEDCDIGLDGIAGNADDLDLACDGLCQDNCTCPVPGPSCSVESLSPDTVSVGDNLTVTVNYSDFSVLPVEASLLCGSGSGAVVGPLICAGLPDGTCTYTCTNFANPGVYIDVSAQLLDGIDAADCGAQTLTVVAAGASVCTVSSAESPISVGGDSDVVVAFANFVPLAGGSDQSIVCSDVDGSVEPTAVSCDALAGTCSFTCENYSMAGDNALSVSLDDSGDGAVDCTGAVVTVAAGAVPSCDVASVSPGTISEGGSTTVTVSFSNFVPGASYVVDCGDAAAASGFSCDPVLEECVFSCGPYSPAGSYIISAQLEDSSDGSAVVCGATGTVDVSAPDLPACVISSAESPISVGGDSDVVVAFANFVPLAGGSDQSIVCSAVDGSVEPTAVSCDALAGTCSFTCENYSMAGDNALSVSLDDSGGGSVDCGGTVIAVGLLCGNGVVDPGEDCDFGFIDCPLPSDTCQNDCTCSPPEFVGLPFLKITRYSAEPRTFAAGPSPSNRFSDIVLWVLNSGTAPESVRVDLDILDPVSNVSVDPPVGTSVDCGLVNPGAQCTKVRDSGLGIDAFPGLDVSGLGPGAYKMQASVFDGEGGMHDRKSVFFVVRNPVPLPELDLVSVSLVALSVLAVLFFSRKGR